MIEIKRNVADDLRERGREMGEDAFAQKIEAETLHLDGELVRWAAGVMHRYSVLTANGVPEDMAKLIAVAYKG